MDTKKGHLKISKHYIKLIVFYFDKLIKNPIRLTYSLHIVPITYWSIFRPLVWWPVPLVTHGLMLIHLSKLLIKIFLTVLPGKQKWLTSTNYCNYLEWASRALNWSLQVFYSMFCIKWMEINHYNTL